MARLNHVKSFRGTSKTKDGTITCDSCGDKIKKGDSYLWWANKMGRMSIKRVRCTKDSCRPKPWDYQTTSPHIAGLMMAEDSGSNAVAAVEYADDAEAFCSDVASAVQEVADSVREVGEGYSEGASNMEEGFGHPTYQSEELQNKADECESQAAELESWEVGSTEPPERDEKEESEEDYAQTVDGWVEDVRSEANDAITEGCQVPG
jgi:hypothetical protein